MNFTAIDFETATSKYSSICSMGICVVENNKIVERKSFLIKPKPFEFTPYNITIHGITPEMVENLNTFDYYWEEILPYLENKLIVAHNASFDIGALCATLNNFSLELPDLSYICTVKLSQKAYPQFKSHKLNNLCNSLGISFNHHQAFDDAYACAMVLLDILSDYNINSLNGLVRKFDINVGMLSKSDTKLFIK